MSVAKITRADRKVYDFIKSIAAEFNIDRCYVIMFSNGGKYTSGRDIRWLSMTNEYNKPGSGLSYVGIQLQSVIVNGEFVLLMDDLFTNRVQIFNDIKKIAPDFDIKKRQMTADGVESGYNFLLENVNIKLRDGSHTPIGVFSLYFKEQKKLTPEEIYKIQTRCLWIQQLLIEE